MSDTRTDRDTTPEPRHQPEPGEDLENRSFDPAQSPGRTGQEGEGGGTMSGRGQEGETPKTATSDGGDPLPGVDAEQAAANAGPDSPIRGPGGVATNLQPGGSRPSGGPGTMEGALGTGGGSTAGADTGAVKRHDSR